MKDLTIKPGMDTPKAKLKNPAPKDADSLLKQHMDKRQQEKEPDSRDPVRYATDRVEENMRRGAALAADNSRRMMKRYQAQKQQGKNRAAGSRTAAETPEAMGGVTATEGGLPYTPVEYSDVPPPHAAQKEVGQPPFSSQTRKGAKSANAAPQERGRQKAIQDAKAAYRRNLAEKRTAERHIVPPPSDRGGTMTTPQKGNSGASAKGSPAPKSGQAMPKATRTMRVRPTDHAAPNNAIVMRRARAAAQRKAQRALLLELLKDVYSVSGDTAALLRDLPEGLSPEREAVVRTACSLVGKVNYFWGGKSLVIGWDARWGEVWQVTAAGSSTTGTYRPYGLDCSGFVNWVFYNQSCGSYVIGHGGGATMQHSHCTDISWADAQPGDLVFYPDNSHVGIVGGWDANGELLIIHCASGANNVVVTGKSGFASIGSPKYYSEQIGRDR